MKKIYKICFLLTFVVFNFYSASSQSFIERLTNNLDIYNSVKPTEKIYLHLDKTLYQQADYVFYKLYLTEGLTNKLSDISNIAYVELIDPKGSVIDKKSLLLSDGVGSDFFELKSSYKGGLYKIKAYTNWLKNFENPAMFEKEIIIQKVVTPNILLKIDFDKEVYGPGDELIADFSVKNLENRPIANHPVRAKIFLDGKIIQELNLTTNTKGKLDIKFKLPQSLHTNDGILNVQLKYHEQTEAITRSIPIILRKIELSFFPEGGHIVSGTENKVAFEALNEFGLPADIKGTIIDEDGKIITKFSSFHQGMGAFSFVPKKNMIYKAQILKPFKIDTLYILPKSMNAGFVLSYQNTTNENLNFDIFSNKKDAAYLTASIRDSMLFYEKINLEAGRNKIKIPTKNFSDGIVRVTLFDKNGSPKCERLVYYGEIVPMKIAIALKKDEFSREELTELEIKTTYKNKPVSANLSMAVVDDKNITFADDKQDNILSWLLMSSEIKGKVYEPSFYFDPKEEKAEEALDFVLMTHGWRSFSWLKVLNEAPIAKIAAEKNRTVAGQVLKNSNNKGVEADVWLFELNNLQRAAKLKTSKDGFFIFTNVDPTARLQVVAKYKRKRQDKIRIEIFDNNKLPNNRFFENNTHSNHKFIRQHFTEQETGYKPKTDIKSNSNNSRKNDTLSEPVANFDIYDNKEHSSGDFGYYCNSDISEVVVTTMGASREEKKIAYSAVCIESETIEQSGIEGKISGVNISNASGEVGATLQMVLRGFASSNSEMPLMIVDGIPISNSEDNNIDVSDIESIDIISSPEATAMYGSRGANGVIRIEIKESGKKKIEKRKIYRSHILPQTLKITRSNTEIAVYSSKEYWKNINKQRDRNATVYWNANIETNENGKAIVPIYCPDKVSSYKIITEGISQSGNVGLGTTNLNVIKALNIQAKVPYELSYSDIMTIPVVLNNAAKKDISGKIIITHGKKLKPLNETEKEVIIAANSSLKELFTFEVQTVAGQEEITISFESKNNSEKLKFSLDIYPKGFLVQKSFAGNERLKKFSFNIDKPVKNSINGQFRIYGDVLADFEASLNGMFRQPWGCFEQVSSCTYPNILALNYMKSNNISNPKLTEKALGYIETGYKRIAAYETAKNGFEWYGRTPPHEVLTAYGLLELIEMKKVYPNVDDKLIERTKKWLMSRKDGQGNFKQHQGKYAFSGTPQKVANAYIVYALARAKLTDFEKEYELAKNEAIASKDAYRLGLMTNAAYYMNKTDDFKELLLMLKDVFDDKDFENISVEASITHSWGNSLSIEVTSIYLLALLKEPIKDLVKIEAAKSYILSKRRGGYFGNTQGTIMALTALTEYNNFYKESTDDIVMQITANGNNFEKTIPYQDLRNFSLNLNEYITEPGEQGFEINLLKGRIPYSFDFKWNSLNFIPDTKCKIELETNLENNVAKVGDNVRMNVIIANKTGSGLPMTIAEVGIPAGLSLQPWQLKKMTDENAWDYYEIFNGKLVVYYAEMGPKEKRHLKLDLKADIAGTYTSRASSSYLYYTNEFKDWAEGLKIKIIEDF